MILRITECSQHPSAVSARLCGADGRREHS